MVVGGQSYASGGLFPGKRFGINFREDWADLKAALETENLLIPPVFEPRIVQPVAGRCTGYAILAPNMLVRCFLF
jgi:hypothetical protein